MISNLIRTNPPHKFMFLLKETVNFSFQILLNDDSAGGVFTVQQNGFAVIAASLAFDSIRQCVCAFPMVAERSV